MIQNVGGHGLSANQQRFCTAADGRLVIPLHGAPGTYQLYLYSSDGSYGAQWVAAFGGTGDQFFAKKVTVPASTNVTLPDIRMDRPGSITGVARDAAGAPLGNVCALPYAPDADGLWRESPSCTDAQGRYTITGLGPYQWPVLFMGDTWLWSGNKSNRLAATKVQVRAGQTAAMDAVIPPGATITGTVFDSAGVTQNASVRAYNVVTGDFAAPSSGSFFGQPYHLVRIAPQPVRIEYWVNSSNGTLTTCWYNGTTDPARARVVPVAAGATINLDLTGCG
jgi:hypothetical protein